MRKVTLSMEAQEKYEIIKRLSEGHITKSTAGVKGLVIQTFSNELLFSVKDRIYELDEIPLREQTSRNFDFKESTEKPKKRNIPSPKHPWRNETFLKHIPYDYFPNGVPV